MSRPGNGEPEGAHPLPIDGTLDLHTFSPREVNDLVPEYLAACRDEGIDEVRIIHGKGTGALRDTVHAILKRTATVARFRLAPDASGWGATLVTLKPKSDSNRPPSQPGRSHHGTSRPENDD